MEKYTGKTNRSFNSRMQARLLLVFCVVTLALIGLMVRMVYIVQVDGDRYAKKVLSRQSYVSSVLPYKRGDILDRNGTVLATSELQYRLILDPKLLLQNSECIEPTKKALQSSFGIEPAVIQEILDKNPAKQYVIVQKELKYDVVQSFKTLVDEEKDKEKKVIGVWFEEQYVRTYPYKTLACDVLGFTSADNNGFWGIEEYYSRELNGTNGREYGYYDSQLDLERIVKKPVNGNSVISSIDANVQRIIQKKIVEFNQETGSKGLGVGVLVMDPNNGEILAMASNQEYDLNQPQNLEGIYTKKELKAMSEEEKTTALNTLWKNDAISSGFEPGSTFKPITISAALEEGVIKTNSTYYCDGQEEFVGAKPIHCSKRTGHGELTLTQSLMFSCNDALMQIAAKEGRDIFYRYENDFGLGKKTGIDLPGEATGQIFAKDKLNPVELATSSFGQAFNVTMVQMASAFSSLVNGGSYYQPHVIKEIINDSGATVKKNDGVVVRQTVSEQTSNFIQQALYKTVEEGTAHGAKVEGYAIGGKTGTAEKYPRGQGTYLVSFIGCVPAINPDVVIYVTIDEPQNVVKQADSSIATVFAGKILKEILPALNIYPEGEIDYLLGDENSGTAANSQKKNNAEKTPVDNKEQNTSGTNTGSANSNTGSNNTEDNATTGQTATDKKTTDNTAVNKEADSDVNTDIVGDSDPDQENGDTTAQGTEENEEDLYQSFFE